MKLDRLMGILTILLQQDRTTAPQLARRFEVSRRTINRDIETLCQAGIPIVTEQGAGGGISIMEGYRLDRTLLTGKEMQGILEGLRHLDAMTGGNHYGELMNRLQLDQGNTLASNQHILIDLSSWKTRELGPVIQKIQSAIEHGHPVEFSYFGPSGDSIRQVEPQLLVFRWFSWYLWGYCRVREDFRLFKLSRLDGMKILEETITKRPECPLPEEHYNTEQVKVTCEFDASIKWKAMEEFGRNRGTLLDNENLVLEFTWSDQPSLFAHLLSYGADVKILEPLEMQRDFCKLVEAIQKKYSEHDI